MGVSFKVGKAGTRYRPKLGQVEDKDSGNDTPTDSQQRDNEGNFVGVGDKVAGHSNALAKPGLHSVSEDLEVSFSLNLFPNGFSVGQATELFNDVPKQLHPYDRASETLFSAIEYGCLPGDLFDDIPCKYINGALLCEIRDYRNSLPQKGETASSAEKSPIIHKVLLQMCMENIVKDISSISDESWTYKDLLEIESRILKALQPDLHLNPKPMQDKFYAKPLTKKLNLGIVWSREKRMLCNAPATNLVSSNPLHGTHIPDIGVTENSKSQSDLAFQDRGVQCSQQTIPSSILNSQENNVLQETITATCNRSLSTALMPPDFVSASKQHFSNCYSGLSKPSPLLLGERGKCETEPIGGPIIKKPKQEPLGFSQQQLPMSQAETILAAELQWKNKLLLQRIEAEKILHEGYRGKRHPSLLMNNGQRAILEGIPKQAGMPTCSVKQEPAETSGFSSSDVGKIKDNYHVMDMRNNQSHHQQSQLQQPSPLLRAKVQPDLMQWNHMGQPVGKNMTNEIVTQKGKALQNPQVSTAAGRTSVSSYHSDSLPREASQPAKRKSSSRRKGSIMNRVGSLASTNNVSAVNANSPPAGNLPLPQPSVIESDPVLERFLKIEMVTRRYGLDNRKRKFNQFFERKPFFHTTPLVAFHLLNSENNGISKEAIIDEISVSKCFLDRNLNVPKTRALTFVRSSHVYQGNEIPVVSEAQCKLVLSEKLNERMVEASILYGHEKVDPIKLPLLPTPNTHHADFFAAQFTSLMAREGYHLAGDQLEPTPLSIDGGSSSQRATVISSATSAAGTVELPSPTPVPRLSPYMLSPMSGSMSALNPRQLPLQNILSGGHFLPPGNIQSALQLSAGYLSKSQIEIAAQLCSMQPQWQQVINKRTHLQIQMQQRHRQQQELLQRRLLMGGLGAATGSMQLGGGTQGLGNNGLGSFGNVMGMGGSVSVSMGGHLPGIGNVGQVNNLGSNLLSFNESKQHFGGIPDPTSAVLSRLRMAESRQRAQMCGVSVQRNASVVPMRPSEIPGTAFNMTNQQPLQLRLQQQSAAGNEITAPSPRSNQTSESS